MTGNGSKWLQKCKTIPKNVKSQKEKEKRNRTKKTAEDAKKTGTKNAKVLRARYRGYSKI